MTFVSVLAGTLMLKKGGSLNPAKFPNEIFELLSIPSFDKSHPEIITGSEIGSSKICVEPNDVLLSKIVPHIRRCWVVPKKSQYRQIASGEWIVFRDDRFHPDYLKYFLISNIFHRQFMETVAGVGGSLVRARPAAVENIHIPLPPLPEQKRIAAILDKADSLRRKNQQAIQLADQFLRAVFLDLFGDPVTNPKGWDVKELKDGIISIKSGWSANGESIPCNSEQLGVLKISAVTSGVFKASENKYVPSETIPKNKALIFPKKGDLLFSRANTRELVAATCIVPESNHNVFLPDKLWKVETNKEKLMPEFLHYSIQQPRFRELLTSQATGTSGSMLNISKAKFEESELIFPDIGSQKKFAEIYWKIQKVFSKLNQSGVCSFDSFNSLSQKAFTAEL
ncbi:restriction endonuclease subunit S [Methylicorpusculum sp.]|uniref:restriction endonuclease subunit S n=1 Tax=Methylicorpusculum sp. TaxID=2713644 RepID=UPI00272EFA82|nr:restriction endonuclease subunit S [Methylicorpusculum sp.]MDP2179749.1 restriction endonuclease subunit S [Methylicorpusculum sp.]MDP3528356.1 restriction endonuclease subunit S [Methylicorpusculum sp.]MDZ4150898.1 restriction endonuclease subunit S [Methylicorpusculum sp.]